MPKRNNITHLSKPYQDKIALNKWKKYNGAYYYSEEIVKNMIPLVDTKRPFVTINTGRAYDHAIVFIHSNILLESTYNYLHKYKDLILVCGLIETQSKMDYLFPEHKVIYLPLSVDVDYVKQFYIPFDKKPYDTCYAGRVGKFNSPSDPLAMFKVKMLTNMERNKLLPEMAKYQYVYSVGRCAIEAQILGCKVLNYDPRFSPTVKWDIHDNKEMAKVLNQLIKAIDYGK